MPVNLDRLYDGEDPHYELWLLTLVEEVSDERARIQRELESKVKGKH